MKKVGVLSLILILFSLAIVLAQNETIDEKAFSCLEDKLGDDCADSDSVEQLAFSLLAFSDNSAIQSDCKSALLDKESGDSFGNIKDTSLAIIALNYIRKNTDDEQDWLLEQKKPADLEWHLEIDASEQTQCKVNTATITINQDKKISGSPGSCFSISYNGYWLRISETCFGEEITVSCDQSFISTLIYKKPLSNIWHVSSDVQSASSGSQTKHQVDSYCFGSPCNYEANLWAVLALSETGNSILDFLPYLIALADDNEKYFPSSFLYIITGSNEYLQKTTTSQKTDGSWKLNTNEYYDTALGLLALYDSGSDAISNAINWLSEKQIKTGKNEGCWNNGNIRDTAFLLWAAFPGTPVTTDGVGEDRCEPTYYCISQGECDEAGGLVFDYFCPGLKICCDTPPLQKICTEEGGVACSSGYICDGRTTTTSDEPECCLGTCIAETSNCVSAGYYCRSICLEDEESTTLYDCLYGDLCCKKKPAEAKNYLWIILIILIILVVLGIIFRNKLRVLIFKFKNKFKKGPVTRTRPRFPPAAGMRRPMIRRPIRGVRRGVKRAASKSDKELEETMKKLREMSK